MSRLLLPASRPARALAVAALAAGALAGGAAASGAAGAPDPSVAPRRLLVRYFDAIRAGDKTDACGLYRIPHCGDGTRFNLVSYELGPLERLRPPAEGDWGALVYLYPPDRRYVAIAVAVVTCRPGCLVTGFYGVVH